MNFRFSRTVRRLVSALAFAQLAVTVAVPMAEARLERAPGPVSIERQHSTDCVTVHRPGACVLCQHAATRAPAARCASVPASFRESAVIARHTAAPPVAGNPRSEPPSRAPPVLSV